MKLSIASRILNDDLCAATGIQVARRAGLAEPVEAVSNSIRHACHGTPGHPARLRIVDGWNFVVLTKRRPQG